MAETNSMSSFQLCSFRSTRRFLCSLIAGLTLLACGPQISADLRAEELSWKAGHARANITPERPMWMSGYASRTRPADGKLTDLWAKVLVLADAEGQRAAMVSLDLVGIGRELSVSICRQLEQKYGLQRDQVALFTSHTHTGPVVGRNLGPLHYGLVDEKQRELIEEYADWLEEQVVAAVGRAIDDLKPCRLSWGSGTATFAVNRRQNREAEVPELRAAGQLKGPYDHDVPVLAVHDAEGQLKTVLFGYACHATVLSFYQWSGDYPGFAQIELEQALPGCQAMFFAGCGGDQNPLPRREVEYAREYGKRLADAVRNVLENDLKPIEGKLKTRYTEIPLALDTLPTREEVKQDLTSKNRYEAARARMLLEQFERDGGLSSTYPYPISVWDFGDAVQLVILGGEVVVDYAVRLKSELGGKRTWVAGYSNDVMAYIPSRRVLREGGYEGVGAMVYYGLPTAWAPTVEKAIVDEVHRQAAGESGR